MSAVEPASITPSFDHLGFAFLSLGSYELVNAQLGVLWNVDELVNAHLGVLWNVEVPDATLHNHLEILRQAKLV